MYGRTTVGVGVGVIYVTTGGVKVTLGAVGLTLSSLLEYFCLMGCLDTHDVSL